MGNSFKIQFFDKPPLLFDRYLAKSKLIKSVKQLYSLFNVLLFCFAVNIHFGFAQSVEIQIPANRFQVDDSLYIIVSQIDNIENYQDLGNFNEVKISMDGDVFRFKTVPKSLSYGGSFIVEKNAVEFELFFTQLPIIFIETPNEIVNEPKRWANFRYSDDLQQLSSIVGVEIRGGFSQSFPKKTYDLEFWKDTAGDDNRDMQFGTMRDDDDWVLDALYNEPLRIRSHTAHKLWLELHELHYQNQEPEAKAGADLQWVELMLNGHYNGIYMLSEQVDRKQLELKKFKNNEVRGELFKAFKWEKITKYEGISAYDNSVRIWGGHEMKYPDDDESTEWKNLYAFVDFVLNAPDKTFTDEIWQRFDRQNFIDYYVFVNLLKGKDNRHKNLYTARYDEGDPYFFTPWDLDGVFGNTWNGWQDWDYGGTMTNGFFARAIQLNAGGVWDDLKLHWKELRGGLFSNDALQNRMAAAHETMVENNIYEREKLVYGNYDFNEADREFLDTWMTERLKYLDQYFEYQEDATEETITDLYRVFPNPAIDHLKVEKKSNEKISYQIASPSGQVLQYGEVDNSNRIDISRLRGGLYYINVQGRHQAFFVK